MFYLCDRFGCSRLTFSANLEGFGMLSINLATFTHVDACRAKCIGVKHFRQPFYDLSGLDCMPTANIINKERT